MVTQLDRMLAVLGSEAADETLLGVLRDNGIDVADELTLPEGEFRTYIERPSQGFSLVFTDAAVFFDRKQDEVGLGPLYLSGVFLYAEGKDGYSQFTGDLPGGIKFSHNRDQILNLLGISSWQRKLAEGQVAAERWDDFATYRIHITYSKSTGKPVVVSLSVGN